ncbi:hypothetical protein [Piscinibacter sp.]|uniref:hypothetical protein n=1 Tax=Piscinibacter sp. TaxID=1903157 RepID=UPI0039E544FF
MFPLFPFALGVLTGAAALRLLKRQGGDAPEADVPMAEEAEETEEAVEAAAPPPAPRKRAAAKTAAKKAAAKKTRKGAGA